MPEKKPWEQDLQVQEAPTVSNGKKPWEQNLEPVVQEQPVILPPVDTDVRRSVNDIILSKASKDFKQNPLFQNTNPNAAKNREVYINSLANKGYDKTLLRNVNDQVQADVGAGEVKSPEEYKSMTEDQWGALSPIANWSNEFATNTLKSVGHGLEKANKGVAEILNSLGGQTGNVSEKAQEVTHGGLQAATGGTEVAFNTIPAAVAFNAATSGIKEIANKNLSKDNAENVSAVLDVPFTLASKTASKLGWNPEEGSNSQMVLQLLDFAVAAGAFKAGGDFSSKIKSAKDLQEISKKVAEKKSTPEENIEFNKFMEALPSVTVKDVRDAAGKSEAPQAKEVVAKIDDIIPAEIKITPELDRLQKAKEQFKTAVVSDAMKPIVEQKIADIDEQIAKEADLHSEQDHVEAQAAVKLNDINENINIAEADLRANEALPEVAKIIQENLDALKSEREKIAPTSKAEEIKPIEQVAKSERLIEPFIKGEKDYSKGKTSEDIAKEQKLEFASPEEAQRHIAETSENPLELAKEYLNIEKPTSENYKSQQIEDYGIKMTDEEFNKYYDKNVKNFTLAKKYIDNKSKTPLDTQLQELSDKAGVEITPNDLVEHISRGEVERTKGESEIKTKFKNRFNELTGKNLTPKLAKDIIEGKEKLDIEAENLRAAEEEKQYYESIKEGKTVVPEAEKVDFAQYLKEQIDVLKGQPKSSEKVEELTRTLAAINRMREQAIGKTPEVKMTKEKALQNIADAKKAFIDKSKESLSSGGLQALPEFVNLVKAYVEYGVVTAKEFIADFRKEYPENKSTDKELTDAFEAITKKEEKVIPATTKLRHEDAAKIREELGMEAKDAGERKSAEELNDQADALIKKGYDFPKLVDEIENGKVPTDIERTVLTKYYGALRSKIETMDVTDPKFDSLLAEGERVLRASEVAGTAAGRALQSIQNFSLNDESLLSYYVREKEINLGGELTEKQKMQVKKEYDELLEAKQIVDANNLRLELENAALKAKRNLKTVVEEAKAGTRKSHAERVTERKEIVSSAKEKLAKLRSSSNVTIVPYANEIITISPEIAKFVKSLAAEGIDNLVDVTKSVHKEFVDLIPDLTEKDVTKILAGEYSKKKQTRTEISIQLADLRSEAKLVIRLDDLMKGVEPKSERKLRERNQQIAELQKQIKENDLTKLAARRVRLKTAIGKLEKSLATGDYLKTEPKKEPIKLDAEATADLNKLIKLKKERELRIIQDQYANRTKWQKAKDTGTELLNVPRTLMASMDFSAPLRQGVVQTISHPTIAGKAFVEMFKQAVSQGRFDRWFHDLRKSDEYVDMDRSGLYVADPHNVKLSAKEEQFMNNLAEKIPFVGKLVKGSERAYVSYLNKMRVDLFQQGKDVLEQQGKTFENSPEVYKGLASWVNNSTGRGKIGALETAAPVLNAVMFSPRLMASRLNLMNPAYYAKLPKEVRVSALKDMTKFIGFGLSVLALAKLSGAEVEPDPRSSDFGKIKVGDTRYDIWGGFQQYARFFTQMITGQSKSAKTGKMEDLSGDGSFGTTRATILGRFARGKLAPIPAISLDLLSGRKSTGEPTTVKGEITGGLTPLIFQDMADMVKEKKDPALIFTTALLATFGVGTSTYSNKLKRKEPPTKEELEARREKMLKSRE